MKIRSLVLFALFAAVAHCCAPWVFGGQDSAHRLAFELISSERSVITVAPRESGLTVVCFLGTECPVAQLYTARLSSLSAEFSPKDVRIVGVISNRQDSLEDIRSYVYRFRPAFPIVHDAGNRVADQYRAKRTPEVFVLDEKLNVRYQGRIDDQFGPGVTRKEPSRPDLRLAIEDLLSGKPVTVTTTEPVGCIIGRFKAKDEDVVVVREGADNRVNYVQHVRPMLQKHCVECHRQGEIGPLTLTSYEEVAGWADTMLEVMENGRMPPWHADPAVGQFANARQMPEADRRLFKDWVVGGKIAGVASDDSTKLEASSPGMSPDSWQLPRQPDLIVAMRDRPYHVPAKGVVEYQYFVVDPGFTEDRWVTGAQILPGNRSIVHHAIAFIRPPDGSRFRGVGWLSAYVPGQRIVPLPTGYARKVPAGSKIVFQMHYTTNGVAQEDLTRVGIQFGQADEITHEVITVIGLDQEFEIPPHSACHEVQGEVRWFPKEGHLMALMPHMHYRGKSFRIVAEHDPPRFSTGLTDPAGLIPLQPESQHHAAEDAASVTQLLSVPRYDFNWQHSYVLAKPLSLSNVRSLNFAAVFDNSAGNPFNPDPTQWVNWGDQTWEEMAVAFLEVAEPIQKRAQQTAALDDAGNSESAGRDQSSDAKRLRREEKIRKFVDGFFGKLDKNRDGFVFRSEVPAAVRAHFWRYDRNRDEEATRDEVRLVAEERIRD